MTSLGFGQRKGGKAIKVPHRNPARLYNTQILGNGDGQCGGNGGVRGRLRTVHRLQRERVGTGDGRRARDDAICAFSESPVGSEPEATVQA